MNVEDSQEGVHLYMEIQNLLEALHILKSEYEKAKKEANSALLSKEKGRMKEELILSRLSEEKLLHKLEDDRNLMQGLLSTAMHHLSENKWKTAELKSQIMETEDMLDCNATKLEHYKERINWAK